MSAIGHTSPDADGRHQPVVGSGRRFDPPWRAFEQAAPDERRFDQGELRSMSTPVRTFVETTYRVRLEPGQTLEVTSSVLGRGGQGSPCHALVVTGPVFTIANNPRTRSQFASITNDTGRACTYSFRILMLDWRDATDAVYGITWSVEASEPSWVATSSLGHATCMPAA